MGIKVFNLAFKTLIVLLILGTLTSAVPTDGSPEPEPSAEPEPKSEPEPPTEDKCNCKVSAVLLSMTEIIQGLSDEISSMKKLMTKTCPGFNETDLDSEDDDSVSEEIEKSTEMEIEVTTLYPPIPTSCSDPFDLVAGSCYYFMYYASDWKSWGDANAYCQSIKGTLAAPYRLEQLRSHLKISFSHVFWVGARKQSDSENYEWLNGSIINAEDFRHGHPTTSGKKTCIYLESTSGYKAVNYYCGEKFSFVCEQREFP